MKLRLFDAFWRLSARILDALRLKELFRETVLPRLLSAVDRSPDVTQGIDQFREVSRELRQSLKSTEQPILLGPWSSEVGFETLYWIPFLRHVLKVREITPERVVAITRGGASCWYEGLADRHLDIFDLCNVDEYKSKLEHRWNTQRGQKQMFLSEWDSQIISEATRRHNLDNPLVIHPHYMNRALRYFWSGGVGIRHIVRSMDFSPFSVPDGLDEPLDGLPEDYLAVRFYFNASIPETPEAHTSIHKLISNLTADHNVVLLNPGYEFDDHIDFSPQGKQRIFRIDDKLNPRNNLEVQTRVIRKAKAFVGTYGGLSYLPLFYGVPSISYYSFKQDLSWQHMMLANTVSTQNGTPFYAVDLKDTDLLSTIF